MAWISTLREDELPIGSCREVVAGDDSVLLVRTGQGFFACAAYCPHKAMNLEAGEVEGVKLTCPLHAATFDLRTGTPEPETDWAGHLQVYPTKVEDGVVMVEVDG